MKLQMTVNSLTEILYITEEEAVEAWKGTLEKVFKTTSGEDNEKQAKDRPVQCRKHLCMQTQSCKTACIYPGIPGNKLRIRQHTELLNALVQRLTLKVFKNLTAEDIHDSVELFEKAIDQAQIIMFPGGFSAGDEPDGSAKFFATAFQNAKIKEAVMKLVNERDGLALGICNGFQALIKLGLVPYGEICGQKADSPTLTFNTIGRHISKMVYTKVVSNKSPWLAESTAWRSIL